MHSSVCISIALFVLERNVNDNATINFSVIQPALTKGESHNTHIVKKNAFITAAQCSKMYVFLKHGRGPDLQKTPLYTALVGSDISFA